VAASARPCISLNSVRFMGVRRGQHRQPRPEILLLLGRPLSDQMFRVVPHGQIGG